MVLANESLYNICEGLKHKFLYKNDINSIHILLNLYDLENNLTCVSPKYISTNDIKRRVRRLLLHRMDRDLVSNKVTMLIHDDIDRLELNFHLEGYKNGYYDNKSVNTLEDLTISLYPIEKFYEFNYLFHYNSSYKLINNFKEKYFDCIDNDEHETNRIDLFIKSYVEELIKPKIYRLNENLDKQLKFEFIDDDFIIKEEGTFLTIKELNEIYSLIVEILGKNITEIYKNASWFGINDRLLNRY